MNHVTEKLSGFLLTIMMLVHLAGWIGSGYLAWHWISPESFGGGIVFIVIWGVIGKILQALVPLIVIPILIGLDSLFTKPSPPSSHSVNLPQTSQLPVAKKSQDNDYGGWIFGALILGVIIYLSTINNEKKSNHDTSDDTIYNASALKYHANSQDPTAKCEDGSYSYSISHQGTCSHHGGVDVWLDDEMNEESEDTFTSTPTIAPTTTIQNPIYDPKTTVPAQVLPQTITMPTVSTATPTNEIEYAQAKAEFDTQIININQVWQQLHASFRKYILPEQRAFNQQREAKCKEYSLTITGNTDQQETANLLCQITALKTRTQYLKTQINTKVIPPALKEKPSINTENPTETEQIMSAKKSYDDAIFELNQAWQKLDPALRQTILLEQRANNKKRETECREYVMTVDGDESFKESARLTCEVPLIKDRTEYLRKLIDKPQITTITKQG